MTKTNTKTAAAAAAPVSENQQKEASTKEARRAFNVHLAEYGQLAVTHAKASLYLIAQGVAVFAMSRDADIAIDTQGEKETPRRALVRMLRAHGEKAGQTYQTAQRLARAAETIERKLYAAKNSTPGLIAKDENPQQRALSFMASAAKVRPAALKVATICAAYEIDQRTGVAASDKNEKRSKAKGGSSDNQKTAKAPKAPKGDKMSREAISQALENIAASAENRADYIAALEEALSNARAAEAATEAEAEEEAQAA